MKFSYVTKKKLSRADLSDYLAAAQSSAGSLFYVTTIACHFPPLLRSAQGRSDGWATLLR